MPKQTKTEQTNGSAAPAAAASADGETSAAPKKRTRSTKTAAKKPAAKKASAKKTTARKLPRKSKGYEPSDDEIRLRAYFIAENRVRLSLTGDAAQDWLDARQQLIEEYGERRA